MIKNREGYLGTSRLLQKWKDEYAEFLKTSVPAEEQWKWDANKGSMEAEIRDLEQQLREFEDLTAGKVVPGDLEFIHDIPELLIKWRLAKQWSRAELAQRAGVDVMELFAYEKTDYGHCPFETMCRI